MNRLDKKQIFIGTILGIILSILTLILLTRNIQPLSAQQTTQKYTTFKTDNQGFKFLQRKLTITGAYYEGENTKTNYGSAPTSDIGKRYYLYEMTGEEDTDRYPRLSCDTNNSTVDCPNRFFESTSHFTSPPQYAGDTYRITSGRTIIIKQKVYTFREPVIVKPIYREETNLAPIFAQTPTTTSPGNQVVTKEYVDNNVVKKYDGYKLQLLLWKTQTTEVWTDHFIYIYPHVGHYGNNARIAYIIFYGAGPGGTSDLGRNCALGQSYFDCTSLIRILNPFEFDIISSQQIKSMVYNVTLRGRTGAFYIDFCQNFSFKGAPNDRVYWKVGNFYDAGGFNPGSDYAQLLFAVDRAAGAGTAFIQVSGPWLLTDSCNPSSYSYSK